MGPQSPDQGSHTLSRSTLTRWSGMARSVKTKGGAKRLDRFMAWFISLGGMTIIAAVLGILLFIGNEAYPLFLPARSKALGEAALPASAALLPDESGKVLMAVDPAQGVRGFTVPEGKPLGQLTSGPLLPWLSQSVPDAKGTFAALGSDGKLSFGRLSWDKPGDTPDASKWAPAVRWDGAFPVGGELRAILGVRALAASGLAGGESWRVAALDPGGALAWAEFAGADAPPAADTDSAAPPAATKDATRDAKPAAAAFKWQALPVPADQHPVCARLSGDGKSLYAGTREGSILLFALGDDGAESSLAASLPFGEAIHSLGFALGQNTLLVGGEQGALGAVQALRQNGQVTLQAFHRFPALDGPVLGFAASLRDKRFLSWSTGLPGGGPPHLRAPAVQRQEPGWPDRRPFGPGRLHLRAGRQGRPGLLDPGRPPPRDQRPGALGQGPLRELPPSPSTSGRAAAAPTTSSPS